MEISGLPLHPLVVHAAVVLGPLAALTALVYAAVGRWRDRLRIPMVVVALAATASVAAAFLSGDNFLETNPQLAAKPYVELHEERADLLLWLTLGFGAVALAAGWLHDRSGAVRTVLRGLLAVAALAVLVMVVLVGDAGARAVWTAS
ncbi:hypothetical protein GCM10009623_31790 [Nocardioides aestuarii]|uniref:DUF2231 domain-containing protein n=1 Tax=Nocardioides aestuarii TaxID=252231 RepID=A0ABW4TRG1_9ACTN